MLKVRLMGTTNDIKWFLKLLGRDSRIIVDDTSEMFNNKGTLKYKRVYTNIYRKNELVDKKEEKQSYFGTGKRFY